MCLGRDVNSIRTWSRALKGFCTCKISAVLLHILYYINPASLIVVEVVHITP